MLFDNFGLTNLTVYCYFLTEADQLNYQFIFLIKKKDRTMEEGRISEADQCTLYVLGLLVIVYAKIDGVF